MKGPPFMLLRFIAAFAVLAASPVFAQRAAPVAVAPSPLPASLTAAQRSAAVAAIVKKVTDRYVFPDRVPAIVGRLNEGLASGRYDTDNPAAFAARVTEDLRAASNDRHMYLTYALKHWTLPDENPPVGLILCAKQDSAVAHYALEGLPNKVLAARYRLNLPDEKVLAAELEETTRRLSTQRHPSRRA